MERVPLSLGNRAIAIAASRTPGLQKNPTSKDFDLDLDSHYLIIVQEVMRTVFHLATVLKDRFVVGLVLSLG